MRSLRAATAVTTAVIVGLTACGGSSTPKASTPTHPVTTAVSASQFPFDATSAKQFPGTSLDQRLQMAQQVCDSIKSHGDDYVSWLSLTKTRTDLVPFVAPQQTLAAFSGLAVKSVCPDYLTQLQSALNSEFSAAASTGVSSSGP